MGAGAVASGEDAYRRIRAGASLVQVYTALTYEGLGLVGRINRDLAELLERDGFTSISEAVGKDNPTSADQMAVGKGALGSANSAYPPNSGILSRWRGSKSWQGTPTHDTQNIKK